MKKEDSKEIIKGFLRAYLKDEEGWNRDFIGEQTKELFDIFYEMKGEK